jgi:ribonuclease J
MIMPDKNKQFTIQPLGGLGEVGMNCMLYGFGPTLIPVDCGLLFADTNNFGIDAIFPDFREVLVRKPECWLITHAHEDHIGAVPYLFILSDRLQIKAPKIYAPPFAAALIREKMMDDRYPDLRHHLDSIHTVELDSAIQIADVRVRFVEVRHSTPDSCALSFEWASPEGPLRIFHTADFKIDLHEFEDGVRGLDRFQTFGAERPDFLLMDSTNADREGQSISEREILPHLEDLFAKEKNRIFVGLFSSNVYRIASLIQIAEKLGRKVAIAGRSLQTAHRLAQELRLYDKMPAFRDSTLVDTQMISNFPLDKQFVICSGSQGELRSVLSKLADDSHQDLRVEEGDLVLFSSKVIPGNEKQIQRLINDLMRRGARPLWAEHAKLAAGGPIHASGHARRAELRTLVDLLKPKNFLPVHGNIYQMHFCAELAKGCAAKWPSEKMDVHRLENWDEIAFSYRHGEWQKDHLFVYSDNPPRLLRFEDFFAPSRDPFLWQRKQSAANGVVLASVDAIGMVRVSLRGVFPDFQSSQPPYEGLAQDIEDYLRHKIKHEKGLSLYDPETESYLAEELARFLKRSLGVRPLCVVHVLGSR